MQELKQIVNEKTGSIFHVIGHAEPGLSASIRVWTEKGASKNETVFMFRFRVDQDPDVKSLVGFDQTMNTMFPNASWATKSKNYRSTAGYALVNMPMWNTDGILHTLMQNNAFGVIYAYLKETFGAIEFVLDEEAFKDFLYDQVNTILTAGSADAKGEPAVILQFGASKVKLQDGTVAQQYQHGMTDDIVKPTSPEADDHAAQIGL